MMRLFPWLWLTACGPADTDVADTETGADSGDETDTGELPPVTERLWLENAGEQPRIAVSPTGEVWAATYGTTAEEDGRCGDGTPTAWVRAYAGSLSAAPEEVSRVPVVLRPHGLGLAAGPEGPRMALPVGAPTDTWCAGHDAGLAIRDGGRWSVQVVASSSGDAPAGLPASNAGHVVGLEPDIHLAPSGWAMVWRDAHFGALQRDDRYRADLEIAWGGPDWRLEVVDAGEGAGDHARVLHDDAGRLVVAYILPIVTQGSDRQGLWVARRGDDGAWDRALLLAGELGDDLGFARSAAGDLAVVVYDPAGRDARLFRLDAGSDAADARAWRALYPTRDGWAEGADADLAFTAEGRLVLAWYSCGRVGSDRCEADREGVTLAVQDGTGWSYRSLRNGRGCGERVALGVTGDTAHVLARCLAAEDAEPPTYAAWALSTSVAP
jgi:hypothetical protein